MHLPGSSFPDQIWPRIILNFIDSICYYIASNSTEWSNVIIWLWNEGQ